MKKQIIILATAVIFGWGCTTVKVSKVAYASKDKGIRYSLGKPYIQVTPSPKGDGSYSVEVVYLPDQNQTYAVETSTFLAKNVMEVSVDESGILKKIDWTANTDATVAEATKALGEIAKADVERRNTEKEEEEKEAKAKKKEADDAVKTLQETLNQKRLDKEIAEKELASLRTTYRGAQRTAEIKEKIRQTQMLIARLDGEIKLLETKLQTAQSTASGLAASFNDPGAGKEENAWGPVLFQIVEAYDPATKKTSLELKAVDWEAGKKQLQFQTIAKVDPEPVAVKEPKISVIGTISRQFNAGGLATVEFSFDGDIEDVDKTQSLITITNGTNPDFKKIGISIAKKKEVTMTIKKHDVPAGTYDILLHYSYKSGDETKDATASFKLELIN